MSIMEMMCEMFRVLILSCFVFGEREDDDNLCLNVVGMVRMMLLGNS